METTLRGTTNSEFLSSINAHPNDLRIIFQEVGHKYWIDGVSDNISCTSYIHSFFAEFDSVKIINRIVGSMKWNTDKTYKYYKMSKEAIKKSWDDNGKEASTLGTNLHAIIERFYNNLEIEYTDDQVDFLQFLDFHNDHEDMEMYRTEWVIFGEEEKLAGSVDAIFMNKDGTVSIYDWKRSKEISFKSFDGKMGKAPFEHLEDCNYSHYCLQLNLYRVLLEKYYNLIVKDMCLLVFHPLNKDGKYMKIPVPRLDKEGEMMLSHRRESIRSKDVGI